MKTIVLVFFVGLIGCATSTNQVQRDSDSGESTAARSFRLSGLERAAFDLECPKDQIKTAVLQECYGGCAGAQVGVTGCGKKAVYVMTHSGAWVNNTVK